MKAMGIFVNEIAAYSQSESHSSLCLDDEPKSKNISANRFDTFLDTNSHCYDSTSAPSLFLG